MSREWKLYFDDMISFCEKMSHKEKPLDSCMVRLAFLSRQQNAWHNVPCMHRFDQHVNQ